MKKGIIKLKRFLIGFAVLLISQLPIGQSAILQDDILTIPQGAVIDSDSPAFFANIQLIHEGNGNGNYKLAYAKANNLVAVDTVLITLHQPFPVQVNVSERKSKPVSCVELIKTGISRKANLFFILDCAKVPFDYSIRKYKRRF